MAVVGLLVFLGGLLIEVVAFFGVIFEVWCILA